jgi:hypothetical protein
MLRGVRMRARSVSGLCFCALLAWGCTERRQAAPQAAPSQTAVAPAGCPERAPAPELMPGTRLEQVQLSYWLARYQPAELDEPLLSVDDVDRYNRGIGRAGEQIYSQRDLLAPLGARQAQQEIGERLSYLRERLADGRYGDREGKPLPPAALAAFEPGAAEGRPELRVALGVIPIRCGPFGQGLFEHKPGATPNLAYDRNACSAAHDQDVVQVLSRWPGGMVLARTRYATGWLDASATAQLSPPIPAALQAAFVRGPRARAPQTVTLADETGHGHPLPKHATVPLLANGHVLVADEGGFHELPAKGLVPARRALTRRELLTTAFQFLDSRYGFGDANGGRDCSRLQMDLFESFDLALPRHSGWQAQAGSYAVDLAGASPEQKLSALEAAQQHGAVLLTFPGHVMLYLGKSEAGVPMALHALGEFVRPCPGGGETVLDVQRTVVSDLQLGAGSSRGSLLQRLTTLAVLGSAPPPHTLAARVALHPLPPPAPPAPKDCQDSADARLFVSPAWPVAGQPLRVIATTGNAVTAPALWVFDADGSLASAEVHHLGGPPFSVFARLAPELGLHTAVFFDGDHQLGCKRFAVHKDKAAPSAQASGPVWTPRFRWERDTENLWSAFIEQLFDGAPDDEQTWKSLHALLRDQKRNLLYDHFGEGEDDRLELVPDCADLPYALRAYFSWKLRLPFGYRQCSRGRAGVPPRCGPLLTNLMPREAPDEEAAFSAFVNHKVRNGVHSATGRTHPEDSETDLYPVALTRTSLPPGTVYADPYGHVLILAKWFAQGRDPSAYGILIAAEAQPDGTVGRRRFFPGSFLFDPSTKDVGAGFKHFRPLVYERAATELTALDNTALSHDPELAAFSLQQYAGSKDDFYEAMDRLINPAPLDPHVRLKSLLDALEEAARRRVLSVDNGEQYWRGGQHAPIPMPPGYAIFETEGPWEDFATPSRDMRLLIAIDSVLAVPAQVLKFPERFNLKGQEQAKPAAERLRVELTHELAARHFDYTKSDGSKQTLSLADIVERGEALEIAYDPNDCVELRWGARDGSAELASCRRHAPADQHARMLRYREWFHTRTRPVRGTAD